jgi:protein transport protein SEC13
MATPVASIDSHHEDMIHDSQFDYYSKKLATCSSDRTIKIFDVAENIYHCAATLTVHDGPVWQVSWAHPKFGVILASCSYDGKVVIQREVSVNNWVKIHEYKFEDTSANSLAWAPHELGLVLASAASSGAVVIIEYKDGQWCVHLSLSLSLSLSLLLARSLARSESVCLCPTS